MQGIEIKLNRNKQYEVSNLEENLVIGGENNATSILVHFPEEYKEYSKRVDFKNIKNEKWTIGLYSPEDETIEYHEDFDKLNFVFTLPEQVTMKGELQMQFIAYLADGSNTFVPFKLLKIIIEDSIMYVKRDGEPDLIVKAFEYSNTALALSREALQKTANAEASASAAENSANAAKESAAQSQQSANKAEQSAASANTRAENAEASALASQTSASNAEQSAKNAEQSAKTSKELADTANQNSQNAVNTSNSANEKSTKALEIVDNLTVSSTELDCMDKVSVAIETDNSSKHKNIHFKIPAPKKGTSFRNCGAWDSATQYINDEFFVDTVSMHGCTYYCKKTNSNQQPLPSEENEYWGIIALKGNDAGFTIVDNLESDNASYVLSAKQGKVLKELIASSITTAINNLINGAPENLKTLKALASAINNDPNFYTTITKSIQDNVNTLNETITKKEKALNDTISANKTESTTKDTDLQTQINNMLNGTKTFTLLTANTINLV